jgi:hypothetical protein
MTKTMERILEMVGFEKDARTGAYQIVLELDLGDEEGLRNYTFQAVEGSDSWGGDPRIDVILLDDEDWEPVAFSTFVELFMS